MRCFGKLDWGAKGRTNVIGALLLSGLLLTVTWLASNVNSAVFSTWITPELPNQGVVVMAKASFHKRLDIQNAIRDTGHIFLFTQGNKVTISHLVSIVN